MAAPRPNLVRETSDGERDERPHQQHVMGPLTTGSEHKHEYIHFTSGKEFCVNPHHTDSCPAAGGTREEVLAFCCQAGLWKDEGEAWSMGVCFLMELQRLAARDPHRRDLTKDWLCFRSRLQQLHASGTKRWTAPCTARGHTPPRTRP